MNVNVREQEGAMVVTLEGEIDLQRSPAVRKQLMELMFDSRDVVVDLSGVAYIDSSGIASLVEAYQMARKNNSRFVLAAVSQPAMRVLQLARLDKVFALAETVAAGLKA
ncbi:STAS domain-containing protein [Magnetospirillum moscoviense]|uniref:Anti-sigma factor antagonist n=1 Tax=Magnetospirillum moscoviense TaxID=1437059 RepID=A0A178MX09_9PROT|nr:STAS domain-containing protein [Magnetospirillum moscoviense]MBF0325453.1 STAS domain-containing protein [Alphaproteobacteria bacterium]OAN55716.1 anti-anti-sigma factor [Magnetospirillum moscoviense]